MDMSSPTDKRLGMQGGGRRGLGRSTVNDC